MAVIIITIKQDNGTTLEVTGDKKGAIVTSKEPFTGKGDVLMRVAQAISHIMPVTD